MLVKKVEQQHALMTDVTTEWQRTIIYIGAVILFSFFHNIEIILKINVHL